MERIHSVPKTFYVRDLDGNVQKVENVQTFNIFDNGALGLKDPEGNTLAIFHPNGWINIDSRIEEE